MLPEKRKNLLIAIFSLMFLILLVFALWEVSSYIKRIHQEGEEKPRGNDNYAEIYDYYGITIDNDGVYKIYGINNTDEKYLDVKTFYKVQDTIIKNNKLILYSDTVNELRYDRNENVYYFYELDNFYNKNYSIKLTNDYLVVIEGSKISYRKYNDNTLNVVTEDNQSTNVLTYANYIYYVLNEGIYRFDCDTNDKTLLIPLDIKAELYFVNQDTLMYNSNNRLIVKDLNSAKMYDVEALFLSSDINITSVIDVISDDILYIEVEDEVNVLKKYNIVTESVNNYSYELGLDNIVNSKRLKNEIYYFELVDNENNLRSIIFDMNTNTYKELEYNYLFIGDLDEN